MSCSRPWPAARPRAASNTPDADDDIGDTFLCVTSLPALACRRSKDPRLPEAERRSLDPGLALTSR